MNVKILLYVLPAFILVTLHPAEAQQKKKVPQIGFLCATSGPSPYTEGLLQGLQELGYIEGKNISINYRFAAGRTRLFPEFAAELVRRKVDVIVVASPAAIRPAMQATMNIPIVMAQSDDPVLSGFVASLARPGGNITGLSSMAPELSTKQLGLLKEAVPSISRMAVLRYTSNPGFPLQEMQHVAQSLGVKLQTLEVRDIADIPLAFAAIKKTRTGALVVPQDLVFFDYQEQLLALAEKEKLPTIYAWRNFAEVGGLMSYGPSDRELFRRAATYVHKILKGSKPGDLPVEQPRKFELVINLAAAKEIGLTIPPNILARADSVIRQKHVAEQKGEKDPDYDPRM